MTNPRLSAFMALTLITFSGLSIGCGAKKFSAKASSAESTDTGGKKCTDQLQQTTIPIKMLFVVDTSGSNADNPNIPYVGTDNNKVVRGQSIQEFFNNYKAKTNFSWAINVFNGSSSSALIGYSSSQPAFTKNPSIMQQAITNFFGTADVGETPYMAALDLAKAALTGDSDRTAQTKWVIVFLSDGRPNPDVDQATLNAKVNEIRAVIPNQVTFNTVFYGNFDSTAVSRLQGMASTGGGKFVNTNNSGRSFPIEDVITVPGVCQ